MKRSTRHTPMAGQAAPRIMTRAKRRTSRTVVLLASTMLGGTAMAHSTTLTMLAIPFSPTGFGTTATIDVPITASDDLGFDGTLTDRAGASAVYAAGIRPGDELRASLLLPTLDAVHG